MRTIRRCAFVIAAALLAAQTGCGDAGPVASPANVTLATVPVATQLPTGPTVTTLVLSTKDGVSLDGTPVDTLKDLRSLLVARADTPRMREPCGSSRLHVIVHVDEAMPWAVVCWALQCAADEKVQAYHVHFAVKHRSSGEVGSLDLDLPKAGWGRPGITARAVCVGLATTNGGVRATPELAYAVAKEA